jgi:hypothetical protein
MHARVDQTNSTNHVRIHPVARRDPQAKMRNDRLLMTVAHLASTHEGFNTP